MNLVYQESNKEVRIGDKITLDDGRECTVRYFRPPHKPSSSGKVTVQFGEDEFNCMELYTFVIGAEWIKRENK